MLLLLQTYLRNLKKKQKELSKKHTKEDDVEVKSTTEDEEEDSDLASIARELQEKAEDSDDIFNSPFIKRPNQTKVRHTSDNTTPLPEKEFSFIGSGKKQSIEEEQPQEPNTSKALDKFMRFDKKYSNFKVLKKTETSDDEESDLLTSPAKPLLDKSPSPKSRLRRQAEQAGLKLSIPKKISDASTTSEVSDHLTAGTPVLLQSPRSPRTPGSPMFTLENLHDIEELLEDFPDASKSTERGTKENTPDVKDNFFRFEVPVKETSKVENDELENDVIVTEDDVDEELIEIVLSEEQDSNNKQISETRKESPSLEKPKVSLIRIESATSSSKKSVKKEKKSRKITKADLELKKSAKFSSVSTDDTSSSISKSKSKRRRKKDKSRKLSNKSCYYCKHVSICSANFIIIISFTFFKICEYHQDKLKHDTIEAPKSVVNECVQVGQPNAKYGRGHYLFDPTKDAMYQYAGNDHLAFIKSAWFKEIDEKKLENKAHNLLQSKLSTLSNIE